MAKAMSSLILLYFTLFRCSYVSGITGTWQQRGYTIGDATDDEFGYSVSMNSDGSVVAIGARSNDGINGANAGLVRVFEYNSNVWTQIGNDIEGEDAGDMTGISVSISADGTIVAIGALFGGTISDEGHVRVFQYSGTAWLQMGSNIDGEAGNDHFGGSVTLSASGTRLAVGARGHNGDAGQVIVYDWDGFYWGQIGSDIDGEAPADFSGYSVQLSADSSILAIGAYKNNGAGHVRVYEYNSADSVTDWIQKGGDIDGQQSGEDFGVSVSLSSDGSILAAGARLYNGFDGNVRVFQYNDSNWVQLGADIVGTSSERLGISVSLSADGLILSVGAYTNSGNIGRVRVYYYDGTDWQPIGTDIDGERIGDQFGWSVSMSADGMELAVGVSGNGTVRCFELIPPPTSSPSPPPTATPTTSEPSPAPTGNTTSPTPRPTAPTDQPTNRPTQPSRLPTASPVVVVDMDTSPRSRRVGGGVPNLWVWFVLSAALVCIILAGVIGLKSKDIDALSLLSMRLKAKEKEETEMEMETVQDANNGRTTTTKLAANEGDIQWMYESNNTKITNQPNSVIVYEN